MQVLLSTIGSRGDVQPLVALAEELRALGHQVRLCVPPDFRTWIEGRGFPVTPIGPDLRKATAGATPTIPPKMTPEIRRQLARGTVSTQFETIAAAAQGCDIIVGATALQIAAPSIAEQLRIPYVFVAYCPIVLPSPHHAPPVLPPVAGRTSPTPGADNRELWVRDAEDRYNDLFGAALNEQRAALGLSPVADVRSYVLTDHPWLAADATLAPWIEPAELPVYQPGAWLLADERPLEPEVEAFLDAGEPPIYFGFGSMRAPQQLSEVMVQSARAVGRRAIISRGWADLSLVDAQADTLLIGEVNQQALFRRVAAVVHHGGAGTTAAAAIGGVPQVIIPQLYDQHYWAKRVDELGVGAAHAPGEPTADSLTRALERARQPAMVDRAEALARKVRLDGARAAAERLSTAAI